MKKINLNKRGFTLVELLAVIVILAVIVLIAMNAVIPQMTKARKEAFVTEAEKFIQAAGSYYAGQMAIGIGGLDANGNYVDSEGACINIENLIGDYIEKKGGDEYSGLILITIDPSTNVATYSIALSSGAYYFDNGSSGFMIKADELDSSKVKAGKKELTNTIPTSATPTDTNCTSS